MTDESNTPYDPRVLRTGSRLREYIVERVLGKGGFGITYLARHQHLSNMLMAIKEYMPSDQVYRDDRSMVHVHSESLRGDFEYGMKRFINEAKSLHDLAQQRHPSLINIVQVKDFFHENGTAYMVMEYVSGDSLEDVIDQLGKTGKKLSEEQLKAIFRQIATAISFVHSRDLLHRDITPSNIILRERAIGGGDAFQPVLIDFGSAKVSVAQTIATKRTNSKFTMAVYTPSYAPLEQCDGMDQDHRTDIYGLAATMYHLTLRRLPIESLKRRGTMDQGASDPNIPAMKLGAQDGYSRELLETIDKGMALRIIERPPSIEEWVQPLFTCDIERPGAPHTPPTPPTRSLIDTAKTWLSDTRNKAIAGAGVAVILLTLFVLMRPTPVEELIDQASVILAESPFVDTNIADARAEFLKIQLLDRATREQVAQADSGVAICDLISGYNDDISDKALNSAKAKLDTIVDRNAESQLDLNAVDQVKAHYALESALDAYSELLIRANLDSQFVSDGVALLDQMTFGGDTDPRKLTATHIQQIVTNASSALTERQFALALNLVAQAEEQASKLGYRPVSMDFSRDLITTERRNYVLTLNQEAVDKLVADGTNGESLNAAKTAFSEILRVDPGFQEASDGRDVVVRLETLRNDITSSRSVDVTAAFSQLAGKAQSTGIRTGDWSSMQTGFHALTQSQSLQDQRARLSQSPFESAVLNESESAFRAVMDQVQALGLDPQLSTEAVAGLRVVELLRGAESDSASHLYAKATQRIADSAQRFEAFSGGANIQTAVDIAIAARLSTETQSRRGSLLSRLSDYRFPSATTDLRTARTYLSAVAPEDAQGQNAESMIQLIETARANADSNSYVAIYEQWTELEQLAQQASLAPAFIAANREWLDNQAVSYAQNELKRAFESFASRPFESAREETLREKVAQFNQLAQRANQSNEVSSSVSNALTLFNELKNNLDVGAFAAVASTRGRLTAALAATGYELRTVQASLDGEIGRQQSGYIGRLNTRVSTNLNAGYQSLKSRPLNSARLEAFSEQLSTLGEVKANTQVTYDWSDVDLATRVVGALKAATALARDQLNYPDASRRLTQESLNVPENSAWRAVIQTAVSNLQKELSDSIDKLTDEAAKALIPGRFDEEAWTLASSKYDEVRRLERSDGGVGKAGIDFVTLLRETAGPFERNDPAFILSGGNNFEEKARFYTLVPAASEICDGIIKELKDAQTAYLSEASKQVSVVFNELSPPLTQASLQQLKASLTNLERTAQSNQDLATSSLITNVNEIIASLQSALSAQQSKNYSTASKTLQSVKEFVGYDQLNRAARNKIDAAVNSVLDDMKDPMNQARLANSLVLLAGFDSINLDPTDPKNHQELEQSVRQALTTQPDYEDALVAQRIAQRIDTLKRNEFNATDDNCELVNSIQQTAKDLQFPGLKLEWIGELEQLICQ